MNLVVEFAVAAALVTGAVFTLVGSFGLLKLNNSMSRLHAPTKAGTLGVGSILLASVIHSFTVGSASLHELLIMAFLFVTAPVSAHFIAKVAIHRGRTGLDLPSPGEDRNWATKSAPHQDGEVRPDTPPDEFTSLRL